MILGLGHHRKPGILISQKGDGAAVQYHSLVTSCPSKRLLTTKFTKVHASDEIQITSAMECKNVQECSWLSGGCHFSKVGSIWKVNRHRSRRALIPHLTI